MNLSFETSRGPATGTRVLGWLIAAVYLVHGVILVHVLRTEKASLLREELRGWHYLIGLILSGLLVWRLIRWSRERDFSPPTGLSPAQFAWARSLALTSYVILVVMPVLGVMYAWHEGRGIHFGPLPPLPAPIEPTRAGWMLFGYFHSALGYCVVLLGFAALLTGLYTVLRTGRGLIAAFPPGFGAQVYGTALVAVYALSTFRGAEPGRRALAVVLLLTLIAWLLGRWLDSRRRGRRRVGGRSSGLSVVAGFVALVALIGFGLYLPHLMLKVTPWPVGEAIEVPAR